MCMYMFTTRARRWRCRVGGGRRGRGSLPPHVSRTPVVGRAHVIRPPVLLASVARVRKTKKNSHYSPCSIILFYFLFFFAAFSSVPNFFFFFFFTRNFRFDFAPRVPDRKRRSLFGSPGDFISRFFFFAPVQKPYNFSRVVEVLPSVRWNGARIRCSVHQPAVTPNTASRRRANTRRRTNAFAAAAAAR